MSAGISLRSESDRLRTTLERLGLSIPEYAGRSVVNVAASIFRAGGGPSAARPRLAPPLAPDLEVFPRTAPGPILFFLMDGFGWSRFRAWRAVQPRTLRPRWADTARPITTVFPSTTTAALVSISTASPPSQHGVVGFRQYLPRYGSVVDMLRMSPVGTEDRDTLVDDRWRPSDVSGIPSVFRRGLDAAALTRDRFRGSGFTRVLYDGAEYVDYTTASDLAYRLVELLSRRSPPSVIYAYWDELDTVLHLRGIDQGLADLEFDRLRGLIAFAARRVPRSVARRCTVIITGDHGQVPCTRRSDIRVDQEPSIQEHLGRPLAGDRRAGFMVAGPGQLDALRVALGRRLPRRSCVLSMSDAVQGGLFGPSPYHPELGARLGDLLVLVPSPAGLTTGAKTGQAPSRFLRAAHGGLEPDELLVPLLAGRLAEFASRIRATRRAAGPGPRTL